MDKYTEYAKKNNITRDQAIEILCSDCDCEVNNVNQKELKTKEKLTKENKTAYSTKSDSLKSNNSK